MKPVREYVTPPSEPIGLPPGTRVRLTSPRLLQLSHRCPFGTIVPFKDYGIDRTFTKRWDCVVNVDGVEMEPDDGYYAWWHEVEPVALPASTVEEVVAWLLQ